MSVTSFRLAVAAQLATALGFDFVDGRLEPHQLRNLGCTWPETAGENEDDVSIEQIVLGVRVFQAVDESVLASGETAFNPGQLEEWSELVKTSLDDIQVGTGGVWYSRVTETEFDLDGQCFTATVVGWQANPYHTTS